jgi:autotransporter-associated beta strand protein
VVGTNDADQRHDNLLHRRPDWRVGVNTASGVLSGNGALVVTSAPGQTIPGTLVLGADNTFAGGVTLQGENTLQLGAGGAAGSLVGPLTVAGDGSLAFGRSDTATNSLVLSGAPVSVIQNGGGTLVLTNEAPVFAMAVANAGVLRFATAAAIPGAGASVTANRGGAVAADGAYATVTEWLDSGRLSPLSEGALALTGGSSEVIDLTVAGSGLYTNLSLGASGAVTYSGTLTPINGVRRLGGGGGTLTYATPITDGSVAVDAGAGTVVLDAANTFGGGILVGCGALRAGDPDALGAGLTSVTGGVFLVDAAVNAPGGVRVADAGLLRVCAGGTLAGVVSNDAVNAGAGTTVGMAFDGEALFTHTGDIAGSGGLAVIGGGTLNLATPGRRSVRRRCWSATTAVRAVSSCRPVRSTRATG